MSKSHGSSTAPHSLHLAAGAPHLHVYLSLGFKLQKKYHKSLCHVLRNRRGHAVAQLVEALRYKSEGRGFDSRWCHWNFSLT